MQLKSKGVIMLAREVSRSCNFTKGMGKAMYFYVNDLYVDYVKKSPIVTDNATPVFCWSVVHEQDGQGQSAYKITVRNGNEVLWESGEVCTCLQRAVYAGAPLVSGVNYTVSLQITDLDGNKSELKEQEFAYLAKREFKAKWIKSAEPMEDTAVYFTKEFCLSEKPVKAVLYCCGVGYQHICLNEQAVEDSFLNPAVSNFDRQCYYTVNDVTQTVCDGKNLLSVAVGNGWRGSLYVQWDFFQRDVPFFGEKQLIAELELTYADGRTELIATDETWTSAEGPIRKNGVFFGETYDARIAKPTVGAGKPVVEATQHMGKLRPQTVPPVITQKTYAPKVIRRIGANTFVLDLGCNIAGICEVKIPKNLPEGTVITLEFTEEVLQNGDSDKETIREAVATDTYIAGKENLAVWKPVFTYHGFRYVKVTGWLGQLCEDDVTAIAFYNDVDNGSFFKCGSALVNSIQEAILQTERNTIHHLATDCPQRDERMTWMNDATVRFEEMPYNFNVGRLFPKILDDVVAEQNEAGAITCTAPFVFGDQPADPVCSSFLVLGLEMLMHYGSVEVIEKYYEPFKKWNECLKSYREDGIVNLTYYGDWAGPADYCDSIFDGAQSAVTPGIFMSTGFHYFNYKQLQKMALLLGKTEEAEQLQKEAELVQAAFLNKWFDEKNGYVVNGDQAPHAFALWLGILPKESETLVARRMFEAVKNVGYRITTGNLTTRYLMDMLAKFGYIDAAWKIMTREEYPSWGFMLQNDATTIWERFEAKWGSGMNSHDHPMYGAVGYWFYAYILGVKPSDTGWQEFTVTPHIPEDLLFAEGCVDTLYGKVYVKWKKKDLETTLWVDVPFGTKAVLQLPDQRVELKPGCNTVTF